MAVSSIDAVFQCDIQKVWDTVTSLENYTWRSDISRIEVISEDQFVEYAEKGFPTTFTVTCCEPCKRWEFDIENDNMKGHWCGVFTPKGGQTEVVFTEDVSVKKPIMKLFVKVYLKKQQARYIADLKKALNL